MIGNNACGSRALAYGRTVDNVEALTVLLADGSVVRTSESGFETLAGARSSTTGGSVVEQRAERAVRRDHAALTALHSLVDEHLGTVRTEFGRFGRQVSGYSFEHLLPERGRRFDRFLVGTEGTLGVVLDATVRLVEDAPARALAVLGYPSMADAADAVPAVARDTRSWPARASTSASPGWSAAVPSCQRATAGCSRRSPARRPRRPRLPRRPWPVMPVCRTGSSPTAVEQLALWRIREDGAGLAARSLSRPAQAGWEDSAVPPARLGAYLRDFDALLKEHALDGVPYGHFGDGCVHVRIDFELEDPAGRQTYRRFVEQAADLVASYGGSMSGEHGDGRARSELLPRMYSPQAIALMEQAKRILDPANLLNPGVLVDPAPFDADLRLAAPMKPIRTTLKLVHDSGSFKDAVHRCTAVGKCVADNTKSSG